MSSVGSRKRVTNEEWFEVLEQVVSKRLKASEAASMLGVSKGAVSNRLKKDPHLNALKTALSKGKASSKSLHRPKWPELEQTLYEWVVAVRKSFKGTNITVTGPLIAAQAKKYP